MKSDHSQYRSPARRVRGFTLIEAALATMIIGMGVVATLELFHSCAVNNVGSAHMTTAQMLATNVQEMAASLQFSDPYYGRSTFGYEYGETLATFNDVDDIDGQTFSPPIDAQRTRVTSMSQYSQVISVRPVYTTKLSSNSSEATLEIPKSTYTGAVRVTVHVLYQARPSDVASEVYRTSWVRLDR